MRFFYSMRQFAFAAFLFVYSAVTLASSEIDISFEKFQLDNGLTVIVHEDHKAPIVAVNVWYHVGSKDEKPGKTGFAHLYEHLMFNGTEHHNSEYFEPFRKVGATEMNGTTDNDRTNYFANVPSTAVDMALWMESDRMGHFLGVVTQERLDEQRGVVQNEKLLSENRPYGQFYNLLTEHSFPPGHPYSWSIIGSMDDLNAASLEDVQNWFKQYYGPNNAVIALAGDITVEKAKKLTKKYFGHIPASEPLIKKKSWIAKRSGEKRVVAYDRVPQERIYMSWNVPPGFTLQESRLDVAADILGGGKNSRLYKRLVYDDQIATNVYVANWTNEIAGFFLVVADAKPGVPLKRVENIVNQELAKFLNSGPTKDELKRAKTSFRAAFIRGIERIGGFGGKSDLLARSEVYTGDPGNYKQSLKHISNMTISQVHQEAKHWLSDGRLVIEYLPFPKYSKNEEQVDRSLGVPTTTHMPDLSFPKLQRTVLSNGLRVVLAERHEIPTVNFRILVNAGYAADQGAKLGTSSFALSMLDEGTNNMDALQISAALESLGATLSANSSIDSSQVTMSALKENLDDSLELFADVSLNPVFPQQEIDRLRGRWLAAIQQEKNDPNNLAQRVAPPLIYGEGHAYAMPFTGSGTEDSITSLSRDDLAGFHKKWFRPDNATLIVVGDTTLTEIKRKLEKAFASWKAPSSPLPMKNIANVKLPSARRFYLIDRPGAKQSVIIAAQVSPPENVKERYAIDTANDLIGGNFTSRLNMNLREDKNWTYGARSSIFGAKGQSPFVVSTAVESDKTIESIREIVKEFNWYLGVKPATTEEVQISIDNSIRSLPGRYETAKSVLGAISYIEKFGYANDYVQTYKSKIEAVTVNDVRKAANEVLKPDRFTWVVVGDLARIEDGIRDLNLGKVTILDSDGKAIR